METASMAVTMTEASRESDKQRAVVEAVPWPSSAPLFASRRLCERRF